MNSRNGYAGIMAYTQRCENLALQGHTFYS